MTWRAPISNLRRRWTVANKRVSLKGKGADLFFGDYRQPDPSDTPSPVTRDTPDQEDTAQAVATSDDVASTAADEVEQPAPANDTGARFAPRTPSTSRKSNQSQLKASKQAINPASYRSIDDDIISAIRRVVRTPGREVSYIRLSPEEKEQLGELVYTFKRQGQKLTETDITRIAINLLLADHDHYGATSMLARVIASMRD
jgi:uncharacterized protein involved in copper resistance